MSRLSASRPTIPPISQPTDRAWMRLLLCEVGIALALTSCTTPYAEVSPKKPHLNGPPGSGTLASVEQELDKAIREHRLHPLEALGHCLDALESTTRELRRAPANAAAIRDYDFAIGRVFEIIQDAKLDPWTKPLSDDLTGVNFRGPRREVAAREMSLPPIAPRARVSGAPNFPAVAWESRSCRSTASASAQRTTPSISCF